MANDDHCHNDSNFHCVQCIRWETKDSVTQILIFKIFGIYDGKQGQLSHRFLLSLYSMYPMGNEDHCHTDSKYHCIQSIRWKTGTTLLLIPILTVFRVSVGNYDNCHADSNSQYIQCIRWEKMTTVTPILILTVLSVSNSKRWPLSYRF